MAIYTVTLNDNAQTEVRVRINPRSQFVEYYGVIAAIIDAVHKTRAYKAASKAEDAQIVSIWIDGEVVTQF